MLTRDLLRVYQTQNIEFMAKNCFTMLWLGMGLGKTITTLTDIVDKMARGEVKKTLIFGPIRVIEAVWERESRKWEHTRKLKFSLIRGTPEQRKRALFRPADIYLCNYENMNWLAETLHQHFIKKKKPFPFQYAVYDEISKLKNSTSMRVRGGKRDKIDKYGKEYEIKVMGWRKIINHFTYATGLTGTPASNGYLDLHGQYLCLDGGARLGEFITHYRDNYFESTADGWGYAPTEIGKSLIEKRISDITMKMDTLDYISLPKLTINDIYVNLPTKVMKQYKQVEKDMFTELESGTQVEVFSGASKSNKLLQITNGAVYTELQEDTDGPRKHELVHKCKLEALDSVLEEATGQPVFCSYTFKSDAEEIMKKFKKYRPVNFSEEPTHKTEEIIDRWNSGKIKLLVAHPASVGHGVDGLQDSGSIIVWYGLNWSLELYEQMNARIMRSGQTKPVTMIRILADKTIDLAVADALNRKTDDQNGLKDALARYKNGYTIAGEESFL